MFFAEKPDMKKPRQYHDLDYKRRIVQEYLAGKITAEELAKRENLVRGQIYKWRTQLENRDRHERIAESPTRRAFRSSRHVRFANSKKNSPPPNKSSPRRSSKTTF